jgi:hypothetical protein
VVLVGVALGDVELAAETAGEDTVAEGGTDVGSTVAVAAGVVVGVSETLGGSDEVGMTEVVGAAVTFVLVTGTGAEDLVVVVPQESPITPKKHHRLPSGVTGFAMAGARLAKMAMASTRRMGRG